MFQEDKKISREILNKVSRTFALNIPLLDANKVSEVENQYLLMRFMDTIEDSGHSLSDKKDMLMSFVAFTAGKDYGGLEKLALDVKAKTVDEHDKFLLDNIKPVMRVFESFDEKTKKVSVKWLNEMMFGMYTYLDKRIKNFDDLNNYCYYVAGTVGLYLNDLVMIKDNSHMNDDGAISFGLFLQKVNIIRDFYKDVSEGRCFWPSELFTVDISFKNGNSKEKICALNSMCDSAFKESAATFDYIRAIPEKSPGYRNFCTLPAVIAFKTLNLLYSNPQVFSDVPVKVRRTDVELMKYNTLSGRFTNDALSEFADDFSFVPDFGSYSTVRA